jgi:hypothetical protein
MQNRDQNHKNMKHNKSYIKKLEKISNAQPVTYLTLFGN